MAEKTPYTNVGVDSWAPPSAAKTFSILAKSLARKLLSCAPCQSHTDPDIEDRLYNTPRMTPSSEFKEPCTSVRSVWAGHATVVTDFPTTDPSHPFRVVFDPLFEKSCSPVKWPRRRVDVPFSVEDMGWVDAVVISHNHYDHLSKDSINAIEALPGSTKFFVPMGTGEWFAKRGIPDDRVFELDWHDTAVLSGVDSGFAYLGSGRDTEETTDEKEDKAAGQQAKLLIRTPSGTNALVPTLGAGAQGGAQLEVEVVDAVADVLVSISAAPESTNLEATPILNAEFEIGCERSQHVEGRDFLLRDKGRTRCATWRVVKRPVFSSDGSIRTKGTKVFFGGDTGYRSTANGPTAAFAQQIRDDHGPFNLLLLPAASGSLSSRFGLPDEIVRHMHAPPEDSVAMSQILSAGLGPSGAHGAGTARQSMIDAGYSDKTATIFNHHSTLDSISGARRTMRGLRDARAKEGLSDVWEDGGVVSVQPGVWQVMGELESAVAAC